MVPGDVLRWKEFELKRGTGPDKPRWFVFMGDNGKFVCPAVLFLLTSTTQMHYYKEGESRAGRHIVKFEATPASPFSEDCVLDVEHDHYELSREHFDACKDSIESIGRISEKKLLEIWHVIEKSQSFSPKVKKDIRSCLVLHGMVK